jgi:hypothetical protein
VHYSLYTVASIAKPITNLIENLKGKSMVILHSNAKRRVTDEHDNLKMTGTVQSQSRFFTAICSETCTEEILRDAMCGVASTLLSRILS